MKSRQRHFSERSWDFNAVMDARESAFPDLGDLESKLGRKVPEGLVRSLVGDKQDSETAPAARPGRWSADLERLESKLTFLKQEMETLRAIDVKLMRDLMCINEGIESVRWALDDRGEAASPDGSPGSSSYGPPDGRDDGSLGSLNDDELDSLSVGSYLDTLDDLPGEASPTNPRCFLRVDADEYYCFG
ncbi:leucine rich adaptor protein 1-like isoform X2 [Stigmatopora argus]